MSNQPAAESSDSKGTKRDFSTVILEEKKDVNHLQLVVDESMNDDNSVVDTTEKLQKLQLGDTIGLKASDTNKLDSEPIKKFRDIYYDVGVVVFLSFGQFGSITKIEKHDCSMEKHHMCSMEKHHLCSKKLCSLMLDTIHVEDPTGNMFVTQTGRAYPFFVDEKPFVRRDESWATIIELASKKVDQREEEKRRQKEEDRRQRKEEWRRKKKEEMRRKKEEERRQKKKEEERRQIKETTGQATA